MTKILGRLHANSPPAKFSHSLAHLLDTIEKKRSML